MATSSPSNAIATHVYTLGTNRAEQDRLQRQSIDLRAHSATLLDHVDVQPGQHALDLGCGPAGITDLLAERVGPAGHVVGVDIDTDHVALARAFVAQHRLGNVEILQADARHTGLPDLAFDVVHARYLLVNIPRPVEVLEEMVRLTRPGGWVVAAEVDITPLVCHPPHPAWDEQARMLLTVFEQDGADAHIGRKLWHLFVQAGLTEVGVELRADTYPVGHPRRTLRPGSDSKSPTEDPGARVAHRRAVRCAGPCRSRAPGRS